MIEPIVVKIHSINIFMKQWNVCFHSLPERTEIVSKNQIGIHLLTEMMIVEFSDRSSDLDLFSILYSKFSFAQLRYQQYDCVLKPFRVVLVEYPMTLPPSYPYEEDPALPQNYMLIRCPAW